MHNLCTNNNQLLLISLLGRLEVSLVHSYSNSRVPVMLLGNSLIMEMPTTVQLPYNQSILIHGNYIYSSVPISGTKLEYSIGRKTDQRGSEQRAVYVQTNLGWLSSPNMVSGKRISLVPRRGGGGGESAWYTLFAHALNCHGIPW